MNIFVGNLAPSVTSEDLQSLFDGFGTIIKTIVMRDTGSGRSLGYGHVYLVPDERAREAISLLDGAPLKGHSVHVRECVYRAREDRRKSRNLRWNGVERRGRNQRRVNGRHMDVLAPDLHRTGLGHGAAQGSDPAAERR